MYIKQVHLRNIRSFPPDFFIDFRNKEGWHVLIGDNGSGKTTLIQCIALALMGEIQANGLRLNWKDWLLDKTRMGHISLQIIGEELIGFVKLNHKDYIHIGLNLIDRYNNGIVLLEFNNSSSFAESDYSKIMGPASKWFSSGFGPFRRLSGGSYQWEEFFKNLSFKKLAAHLSLFGEDVALSEVLNWLKSLQFKVLENKKKGLIINEIKKLINSEDFLPNGVKLSRIDSEGVFFKDIKDVEVDINKLSDGYRSILSLTLELIRQMVETFNSDDIFIDIHKGKMTIPVTGVVLIDEIDAHLHPTWQARIGQWFTKYFPNIQFIVTTHSPLICRACGENGSIWRLAVSGSDQISGEVTGIDRERLIYGNVLDAYGTELFGKNVSISKESDEKLNELAELNIKSVFETITQDEENERERLQSFFPTESTKLK